MPGMVVSTCHNYEIFYKFRYGCAKACGYEIGRQSKSIDTARQRCPRCRSGLELLGAFNRDGTPAKSREPSAFAKYVQGHFSALKKARPTDSHAQLMAALGESWRAGGKTPAAAGKADVENLCSNLNSVLDLAAADSPPPPPPPPPRA